MNSIPQVDMRTLIKHAQLNLSTPEWQPMVVLGAPGCGKTYFGREVLPQLMADKLGIDVSKIGVVMIKPAERDGVEIAGVPLPMEGEDGELFTRFTVSPVLKEVEATGCEYGVLIIDEITQSGVPEQKVLSPLLDAAEHALGVSKFAKRKWIVYCTGNRPQDKSGSGRLLAHCVNRVKLLEVTRNIRHWAEDFAVPHGVNPLMIDCALAHDDFFVDSVPTEYAPYCTERSLTRASYDLDAFMASAEYDGSSIPRWMELVLASNIGETAARRVVTWAAQAGEVPTGEEIIRDPQNARVPSQTGFQLVAANLALSLVDGPHNARQVLHYLVRLRKDLQISLGVKLMNLAARNGWIVTDPLAAAFVAEFHEFLPLAQDALDQQ